MHSEFGLFFFSIAIFYALIKICLLYRPNRRIKGYVVGFFTSLTVTLISAVLPRMKYCSWFTVFLGWGSSIGFHLTVLTIIAPHSTGQGSRMGILRAAKYFFSKYSLWPWRNNQRMGSGTHWTHFEMDLSWNSIDHLTVIGPYCSWRATVTLWVSWS